MPFLVTEKLAERLANCHQRREIGIVVIADNVNYSFLLLLREITSSLYINLILQPQAPSNGLIVPIIARSIGKDRHKKTRMFVVFLNKKKKIWVLKQIATMTCLNRSLCWKIAHYAWAALNLKSFSSQRWLYWTANTARQSSLLPSPSSSRNGIGGARITLWEVWSEWLS